MIPSKVDARREKTPVMIATPAAMKPVPVR
jgi:hypothetical protein